MAKKDPFFRKLDNSTWNACIGSQSSEENYVDGYIEAALELARSVIERKLFAQRDTLVLPILYNARHALELTLKMVINRLVCMEVLAKHHPKNHDILSHWKLLNASNLGDEILTKSIRDLEPFVESLSKIDEDGQELRFHERDGHRSLSGHSLTNLIVILESLIKLSSLLEDCKYRLWALETERRTKAFTKFCSRQDLFEIVKMLPLMENWKGQEFSAAKEVVRSRFGLSSREFSYAINIIKANREMCVLLGRETKLLHVSDEKALFVARQWKRLHAPRKLEHDINHDTDLDGSWLFGEADTPASDIYDEILKSVDKDDLADIEAIFNIAATKEFSEFYEFELEDAKRGYTFSDPWIQLFHVLQKTTFLEYFSKGAHILGRPSLAELLRKVDAEMIGHAS
jgi:hypothetical protein